MSTIIGQTKLLSILDNFTLANIPKSILFLGPSGSGKSLLTTYLADKLGLDIVKISSDITAEMLADYYQCPVQKMYLIQLKDFNENQQNKLLKTIEETSANMYIVLEAESEIGILPTILNRCQKFKLEPYTREQLQNFLIDASGPLDLIYTICQTPGQMLNLDTSKLSETYTLCETIVTRAKEATFSNIIKISTKINCKDNYDKIDFELFFKMLAYTSFKYYKENNDEFAFKLYLYLVEQQSKRLNKSIAKESYLLSFLSDLWEMSR